MLYFKSYTIYSLQESVMIPILISHILRTNLRGLDNLFMDKGKIYTFLNPVSYLMALDRKDLFGQFDGIFAVSGCHKIIIWNNSEKAKL